MPDSTKYLQSSTSHTNLRNLQIVKQHKTMLQFHETIQHTPESQELTRQINDLDVIFTPIPPGEFVLTLRTHHGVAPSILFNGDEAIRAWFGMPFTPLLEFGLSLVI